MPNLISTKVLLHRLFFRRLARVSIALSTIAVITWGVVAFLGGPYLRIWNVHFSGHQRTSDVALHHLADIHFGQHIFAIDEQHITAKLNQHPWVRKSTVQIDYPSTVRVEIEEHKPILLLALDQVWYISDEGVPFRLANSTDIDYPIVTGIPKMWVFEHPAVVQKIIHKATELYKACEGSVLDGAKQLSEIHFHRHAGFTVILRNGSKIIFGFYEPTERLERLQWMVKEGLDLSVPQKIVLDAKRVAVVTPL